MPSRVTGARGYTRRPSIEDDPMIIDLPFQAPKPAPILYAHDYDMDVHNTHLENEVRFFFFFLCIFSRLANAAYSW